MSVAIELDLRPALGPVRDQRELPTCLAFAVTAAHEHVLRSGVELSPGQLHLQAAEMQIGKGVSIESIRDALLAPGQALEADCPYDLVESKPDWLPVSGLPLFRRASETLSPTPRNLMSALESGHVPVLGISLPAAFLSPYAPWLVEPGDVVGGLHAVAGVGLGLHGSERCVLIRNSWGPEWGDAGHVWLSERFVARHLHELMVLSEAPG